MLAESLESGKRGLKGSVDDELFNFMYCSSSEGGARECWHVLHKRTEPTVSLETKPFLCWGEEGFQLCEAEIILPKNNAFILINCGGADS